MRIESKLCHLSENKAVVLVKAWLNNKSLGSALAEGSTVEVAEDKAILRLNKRINEITNNVESINSSSSFNSSIHICTFMSSASLFMLIISIYYVQKHPLKCIKLQNGGAKIQFFPNHYT